MVDGVDVVHAVDNDPAHLLQALVGPHARDSVTLDHDVALGEQLHGFEGRAVGSQKALAAFDESLLVAHNVADFDNVASNPVLKNLQCLLT